MYEEWEERRRGRDHGTGANPNAHGHAHRERCHGQGGRVLSDDREKSDSRANIAIENRIPTIYLVDSAGVFLPLQEDVFPDTDDFGRVFRNNAVMSALGIPQIARSWHVRCGGGYLPVMCDHV